VVASRQGLRVQVDQVKEDGFRDGGGGGVGASEHLSRVLRGRGGVFVRGHLDASGLSIWVALQPVSLEPPLVDTLHVFKVLELSDVEDADTII